MGLLMPHTGTIIWMLIAFLTVFFLLKKYAWKPILGALKQRDDSIKNALKAADIAKKDMTKLQADNEKIMAEACRERDKIIKEAGELKETIVQDAKDKAFLEAEKITEAARKSIRLEKEAAIKDIKEHAALLSVYMAEKLLKEKLSSPQDQKELIDKLLRDTKAN